jgi:hypothetical protein
MSTLEEEERMLMDLISETNEKPKKFSSIMCVFKHLYQESLSSFASKKGIGIDEAKKSNEWMNAKQEYHKRRVNYLEWGKKKKEIASLRSKINHKRRFHPVNEIHVYTPPMTEPMNIMLEYTNIVLEILDYENLDTNIIKDRKIFAPQVEKSVRWNEMEECFLCMNDRASIRSTRCSHLISCASCFNKMERDECPFCKVEIENIILL